MENARQNSNLFFDGCVKGSALKSADSSNLWAAVCRAQFRDGAFVRTVSRLTLVGIFPLNGKMLGKTQIWYLTVASKDRHPKVPNPEIFGLLLLHQLVRRGAPKIVKSKFASEVATLKKCFLGVSKFKLRTYTF